MTIIELGTPGEFLGSIAVLATLIYLAMQIRQNTISMNESKKLALAQTCQMRSDALQMKLVPAGLSPTKSSASWPTTGPADRQVCREPAWHYPSPGQA